MSDDRDNPFGPPPPDDPFGPPPATDPFGRPTQGDPYGAAPTGDPYGAAPSGDPYGAAPSGDPYGTPPTGDPIPAPPENEAWRAPSTVPHDPFAAPATSRANAQGAVPALVLGIVSVVFCPLCAPFAWYYGQRAEQLVDASGGVLGGRGEATAGKILGIVMSVLMLLGVALLIVFGVLLAAGTSGP
jgi:hypothetical protein